MNFKIFLICLILAFQGCSNSEELEIAMRFYDGYYPENAKERPALHERFSEEEITLLLEAFSPEIYSTLSVIDTLGMPNIALTYLTKNISKTYTTTVYIYLDEKLEVVNGKTITEKKSVSMYFDEEGRLIWLRAEHYDISEGKENVEARGKYFTYL
ncbi:hypothetical protein [Halopseudomonas salegens]|uniref:Uncharacterized protein n=1 Tax=Halopseudomonas salegens TaxID=1434072 RepID=A0A1H2HJV5_9GAMM|nr:hypothetical protein [Halopseudomonas salegens]SDU32170.1 hypothetical protein SAMN05216210_3100 [Halopseudomonas salegens]